MWYRKRKGFRYLVGLVMGVGLAAGMVFLPVMPVRAATQVSSATRTSAVPTLSDDEFEAQLNDPVDNINQPIEDIFKDGRISKSVADALGSEHGVHENLQDAINASTANPDTPFVLVVGQGQQPITDWRGLSAVAGLFDTIEVKNQPDFDDKAAMLVQKLGNKDFELRAQFYQDDLTTKGFNELVGLSKSGFRFNDLDVSDNQVTDFSAINNMYNGGSNAPVTGMRESGSSEDSALMVHDSSVVITGGVPGARFLPAAATAPGTRMVGVFRIETSNSAQDSEEESIPIHLVQGEPISSPVTFDKLNDLNRVNFDDNKLENVYPWYHAQIDPNADTSAVTEEDMKNLLHMDIQNIPNNVDSLMIRSTWANTLGGHNPVSILVKIPLIHENSQSNLPETSTTSSETTSSQTSDSSQPTGPNIAKKGQAVYALKKIWLYRQPTFTKQSRRYLYRRQPRIRRPQFVVTGYAYSKQGLLRYRVRDVNHHSATANRQGYITAQAAYVVKTYYQAAPKKIRVISPHGVNAYRKVNLTGRVKHYRQGQVLRVKKIKTYHLTTRLILTNGQYITANKTLVQKK